MSNHLILHLACVSMVLLWGHGYAVHVPLVYRISMDGSGDGGEPDLIIPVDAPTLVSTITNTITITMIRLKDFMLTRVVDFLQDNMLIIIVVTSLLIVMIIIICCAATMSQKRKMEAYKPPANPPRKYMGDTAGGIQGTPKNLRTPSTALVGEKVGKEPKPKEVQKVRELEEEEMRRVEPKHKGLKAEEVPQSSSTSQPMVCTCHLRKANH
uniref:Transmembrane protein 119 n=1 Tax=Salmo trutta TaxID=8032 RepID=A0A674BPG7_SALTR